MTRRELITGAAALAAYAMLPRGLGAATDPVPADRLPFQGSWQGIVGVSGGIPIRTSQSGSTIQPYSGSPSTINTALANCPSDQYVLLGPGTFSLNGNLSLTKSNVTLRGSVNSNGMPNTIISFTSGSTSLNIGSTGWDVANSGAFTTIGISGGADRGSSTVSLSSTPSGLSAGMIMFINCASTSIIQGGNWSLWFGSRPFTQVVKVLSVSGNSVSFTPPINADYISNASPQVSYRSAGATTSRSGVENLVLETSGGSSASGSNYLQFFGTDSCWAKNVETYWAAGGGTHHCYVYATYGTEIRECNMHHLTPNSGSSSNGYCVLPVHSSSALIENNYFHDMPNIMPMMGLSGSAFSYNYVNDLPYPASTNWLSQSVFFPGCHSHYNLFEGNWCAAHYHDATASGQQAHSRNNLFFRERGRGWDATGPKTANTHYFTCEAHHENTVIAGCVVGESGKQSSYIGDIISLDSTSASTQLRISNYNTINNGIPGSEALGTGQALPASYIYSSKPQWFGSLPWPWCDPTNFAQSNNVQNLPAGYRAVNGTSVGGGGTVPAAPTNLRIIP